MVSSIRRISIALLSIGVLTLTGSIAQSLVTVCTTERAGCFSNVMFGLEPAQQMTYAVDMSYGQSTPQTEANNSLVSDISAIARAVGTQLIFIAVVLLIILEFLELHYLRQLTKRRRFSF